jgi:hypothetical protein
MKNEILRLAGLRPTRERLDQIMLSEAFPPDMHPHEIAHAVPGAFQSHGDEAFDRYFHASGKAHHAGHAAHELTKMIKSGEISGDPGHHQNAHAMHQHAMELHHHAGEMAMRAGAPWMKQAHSGHAAEHEKHMIKHGKKFKK